MAPAPRMLFPNAKHASSVLFRIVAALLIAVPAFLVLVIVFALAGRRRTSLAFDSQIQPGSREFRCAARF